MASAVLAEELPSPYVPAHPASTTAPHSIHHIISTIIHDYTSHHFNHHSRLHHIISTIIHDFKSRQRRLAGTTDRYFTITVGAYVRVRRATTWTPHGRRGWAAWAIGSLKIPA
jgi:AraC-like DNA-binding protein